MSIWLGKGFDYRSTPTRYANEKDVSLWKNYCDYQMDLFEKFGDKTKSPFQDKKLFERLKRERRS